MRKLSTCRVKLPALGIRIDKATKEALGAQEGGAVEGEAVVQVQNIEA